MKIEKLSKRQVRYWCFRFKTELNGGEKAADAPKGLRKYFESHDDFTSWDKFNESGGWDVKEDSPLELKSLKFGSDELWDKELSRTLRPLPTKDITSALISSKGKKGKRVKNR